MKDVSQALNKLEGRELMCIAFKLSKIGISSINANIKDQLIFIEGTTAPSDIVTAIESTGRDAILRGSGNSNSAGVCILETHGDVPDPIKGLARMVEVGSGSTLIDLTIKGLRPGSYHATIRERGDISEGAKSTGGIWDAIKSLGGFEQSRGDFDEVKVGQDGRGNAFLNKPFSIWEVIGRSIVVSRSQEGSFDQKDPDTLVGVIARSAGVWDNDKTICSCSGKTVWEERKEQQGRGMI